MSHVVALFSLQKYVTLNVGTTLVSNSLLFTDIYVKESGDLSSASCCSLSQMAISEVHEIHYVLIISKLHLVRNAYRI